MKSEYMDLKKIYIFSCVRENVLFVNNYNKLSQYGGSRQVLLGYRTAGRVKEKWRRLIAALPPLVAGGRADARHRIKYTLSSPGAGA